MIAALEVAPYLHNFLNAAHRVFAITHHKLWRIRAAATSSLRSDAQSKPQEPSTTYSAAKRTDEPDAVRPLRLWCKGGREIKYNFIFRRDPRNASGHGNKIQ